MARICRLQGAAHPGAQNIDCLLRRFWLASADEIDDRAAMPTDNNAFTSLDAFEKLAKRVLCFDDRDRHALSIQLQRGVKQWKTNSSKLSS